MSTDTVLTDEQSPEIQARMEAYAAAKVRAVLEEAESIVRNNADACSTLAVKVMLHSNADAIRALMPHQ